MLEIYDVQSEKIQIRSESTLKLHVTAGLSTVQSTHYFLNFGLIGTIDFIYFNSSIFQNSKQEFVTVQ